MTDEELKNLKKGQLRLHIGTPNPRYAADRNLYLISGDASDETNLELVPDEGIVFPERRTDLGQNDFFLTLYHFNDVHGHLVRFTPDGEEPVFTRMAHMITEKQQKVKDNPFRAVMTLSAGDDCIGTVFDELMDEPMEEKPVHASYQLYSAAGVDFSILGNHDFDLGVKVLAKSITNDAKFPILAANLKESPELEGLIYPAAIMVVKGIRVGLIGLVTAAENRLGKRENAIINPIEVASKLIAAMKPYCDVMILLTHLGYSLDATSAITADVGDVELAKSLPYAGVHLIVGGHSHHELNAQGLSPNNIVNGIPIVQAGSLGRYLGRVDVRIRQKTTAVTHVSLIPTETMPIDYLLEQKVMKPLLRRAKNYFSRVIGNVENDPRLSTDFVRNSFASSELALANFISDGLVKNLRQAGMDVDVAMIDSSCVRRGLDPGGRLTYGDWFNLMPFADTIRIYRLTGEELQVLVQDNAFRIDRPGEPNTERGFLQFSSALRYSISLEHKRKDAYVKDISMEGQPLDQVADKTFLVAATSFVRELAGNWENCNDQFEGCKLLDLNDFSYVETDYFLRREMVKYILAHGGVTGDSGALLDGRLKVEEFMDSSITELSVRDFTNEISYQNHAMAGATIASAAATAVSLGFACIWNTQRFLSESDTTYQSLLDQLTSVQEQLLDISDKDANAISLLVSLRSANEEMQGQRLLCEFPSRISQLSIQAAQTFQDFRGSVNERVKDDLEMSITLLFGTAQSAMLLLDSNLRIWHDQALADQFEPLLDGLINDIAQLKPVNRIRS
ncbi:MAG TPA: 5'-nucleotidase C-terminal domain-containing protein [Anaerolineaceae bacterium]|nr:5'-nucleotidase C-terminal domain-containing protein [Anaerolineaceae bacterium]